MRRLPLLLALLALTLLGVRCPGTEISPEAGFVPEARARARALDYLRFATTAQTDGILNAVAHMERDVVDPGYSAPVGAVDVGAWSGSFTKLEKLLDTRDFDGLYLLVALLGYEGHPYVTPALWEQVRTALLSFKPWFDLPTPPVPDPDDPTRDWDESFYWTENHQILYHTIAYLSGQRFPDECFWITGFPRTPDCSAEWEMTGVERMERARPKIRRWLDERWEAGFSEWLSNVYLQKDATPLLALVEFADDEEIRTRAAMVLDVLLMELAVHTFQDTLGTTHGRSAMKDKHWGPANDTWGIVHLLFRQQDELEWFSTGDAGATLFARAKRYRLPTLVLEAALQRGTFANRQRQSYWIDERGPVVPDPPHPPGHSYDDTEANFTFWWGLGAWTAWPVVPLTLINGDRYNMWNMSLLRPFKPLRDQVGNPPNLDFAKHLAAALWPAASVGLLKEANTYTWRTRNYVLSTAQDYRKGANAGQVHAWQATLGPRALVFTTHAMNPMQPPSEWIDRDEGEPGYWTGTASMPRSAQHENVGIHLYTPAYPDGGLLGLFDYEALTHAYFPQDHFDEVDQSGGWTFGRLGDAYVALWSWRPTIWQDLPPEELALLPPSVQHGPVARSFDLVAPGGAENVWIVECGRAADWGSFEAFRSAILAAPVTVATTPDASVPAGVSFDVVYASPSQGELRFGWEGPLVVRGEVVAIADYPRMSNPWVHAERGDPVMRFQRNDAFLELDWQAPSRRAARLVPLPE